MTISEFIHRVLLRSPLLRQAAIGTAKAFLRNVVNVRGSCIWINPNDPVISSALAFWVYEPDEIAFFCDYFRPDMTFIDVGANIGLYTGMAMSVAGFDGKILAIEPHKESRQFLAKTIASNGNGKQRANVMVSALAALDCAGKSKLYKNSQNKGDNRIYPDPMLDEEEVIATDTLDNICQRYGIESVHFMKIDVQGAEAKVISGASNLLRNSADCILMTEFWPYGLSRSGSDPAAYLESLGRLGFTLYELGRKTKNLSLLDDWDTLISRTHGRKYTNLIGLKGRFAELRPIGDRPVRYFDHATH